MARNAIESEFRTSKMADGSHFVNKIRKKKLIIDLKWPEMRSKVNFGHPKWPMAAILWEISKKIKLLIDLKWPEMRSKVNFGYPKWPTKKYFLYRSEMARIAIKSEFQTSKMADRSEMARNTIKSDFRTSEMSFGGHFVKNVNCFKNNVLI